MNHARRRIGWLLLSIILAVAIVGPILYRQYAVKRDIHTASSIYSGIRPNYNMNVPVSYSFVPWEEDAYPATGRFSSSTEYFRNTMTNHLAGDNYLSTSTTITLRHECWWFGMRVQGTGGLCICVLRISK